MKDDQDSKNGVVQAFLMQRFLIPMILVSLSVFSLFAEETQEEYQQWFTGSIIAPSPTTRPPRKPAFELAITGVDRYATYDSHWKQHDRPTIWSIGPILGIKMGFTRVLGIDFIGAMASNFCESAKSTHSQDTILRLGFQISRDQKDSWVPDFRILIQETFPSGNYENLHVSNRGADLSGSGSYQTGIHLAFQKLFLGSHNWVIRGSAGYFVPAFVRVHGVNAYGGNAQTLARVRPGNFCTFYLLWEYSLTRTWAIGLDSNYRQGIHGHVSIKRGAPVLAPAFAEWSIAPQIEHTYSERLASRFGAWFSVIGKNTTAFASVFVSVLYKF